MKFNPEHICQLAFLAFCCILIAVRESDSTFVPGRCLCPETRPGVRGQLKELRVLAKTPSCRNITVIVTMKSNNASVCLDPEAPMGRQLIRCWNRAHNLGRDVKLCLRRRRGKGRRRQRPQQRTSRHKQKASSSDSP